MNIRNSKKGFTIIEVVLVLAIAALIFLMIFVALPALQRGQANTARKSDASTIAAAINTYRTNNSGTVPAASGDIDTYIDKLSQLSTTIAFTSGAGSLAATAANIDLARVFTSAKCAPTGNTAVGGSSKQAAVITILETSAGQYTAFCQNS